MFANLFKKYLMFNKTDIVADITSHEFPESEVENKGDTYQVWMRTWDTMEYVSPLYLTADSFEDAYDKMLIFRDKYQVKSCLPMGEHITEDPRFNIV